LPLQPQLSRRPTETRSAGPSLKPGPLQSPYTHGGRRAESLRLLLLPLLPLPVQLLAPLGGSAALPPRQTLTLEGAAAVLPAPTPFYSTPPTSAPPALDTKVATAGAET